jgi:hypothetical protein
MVRKLVEVRDAWSDVQMVASSGLNTEGLPYKAQKFYGLATARIGFEIAFPRIIDYYRVSGGLDELFIEQPAEDKKEKEDA